MSTHNMFSCSKKKNIHPFLVKKKYLIWGHALSITKVEQTICFPIKTPALRHSFGSKSSTSEYMGMYLSGEVTLIMRQVFSLFYQFPPEADPVKPGSCRQRVCGHNPFSGPTVLLELPVMEKK